MRVKLVFDGPRLSRRQWVGTSVFCAGFPALFVLPSALAGWASVSPTMLVAALVPAAGAPVFWLVKRFIDDNDRRNVGRDGASGEAAVRAAERERQLAVGTYTTTAVRR